ncbi:DNA polymerase IV [Parabacteroides pacaensis]|uniref:DNA polymerase IV n=1 Tax=Parabacteroides pacaensis TaxID=2086575 RepID=UPI000D0E7ADB|nr:DNA polymerase IV [Parabacteroides pacaensis]
MEEEKPKTRKIIHIDMDAFYASIEQRDHPEYRGRPLAVGRSEERGVVAAASYEARRFGVRSAMPSVRAKKLCPHLIFVPSRISFYKSVSAQIHAIFHEYTDVIEPISLDEAFLDVTENKPQIELAVQIAREIKQKIRERLGLVASAGISYNKFLAKIASDYRKPDGLCTIHPSQADRFISELPIESFWGVGKVTAQKFHSLGIHTGKELKEYSLEYLIHHFGKVGILYYKFARGIDPRPVEAERIRKSVGCETTFERDLTDLGDIMDEINELTEELLRRISRHSFQGNTLTLKIKFIDFVQKTRSITVDHKLFRSDEILSLTRKMLEEPELTGQPIRLLGLTLSHPPEYLTDTPDGQLWIPFKEL